MKTLELKPGLAGLLSFCAYLDSQNITYSIHKYSQDGLTVFLTMVGCRVEVEFTEDEASFSVFNGDESVSSSSAELSVLISRHWRD